MLENALLINLHEQEFISDNFLKNNNIFATHFNFQFGILSWELELEHQCLDLFHFKVLPPQKACQDVSTKTLQGLPVDIFQ